MPRMSTSDEFATVTYHVLIAVVERLIAAIQRGKCHYLLTARVSHAIILLQIHHQVCHSRQRSTRIVQLRAAGSPASRATEVRSDEVMIYIILLTSTQLYMINKRY